MEGPNVNFKFQHFIQTELEQDVSTILPNMGICGLHILHRTFKKGADGSDCNVDQFLSNNYWLLKDSSAWREDYAKAVGETSPLIPLKFCKTRWVENVPGAERMIKILPDLKKYVNAVKAIKFPNPGTKSYTPVKDGAETHWYLQSWPFTCHFQKSLHLSWIYIKETS